MRINKVILTNYRVHEYWEGEFAPGVNLLLGANGKGKSSILEAIGYCLFGASFRGTGKDAIRNGARSGKVIVEFTGTDSVDYVAERVINGAGKLYKKGEAPDPALNDSGRIRALADLCGVRGDLKGIYENVIVARQNEFINAFKETPGKREQIFNEVFNTEIYRRLFEGYTKEAADEYRRRLETETANYAHDEEALGDETLIREQLAERKNAAQNLEGELKTATIAHREADGRLRQAEEIRKGLGIDAPAAEVGESDLKIICETLEEALRNYREWQEAERALGEFRNSFRTTEKLREAWQVDDKSREKIEKEIVAESGKENEIRIKIQHIDKQSEEAKTNFDEIRSDIDTKLNREQELEKQIAKLQELLDEIGKLEEKREKWVQGLQNASAQDETLESLVNSLCESIKTGEKREYKDKIVTIEGLEKEQQRLKALWEKEKTVLETNEAARAQLKGGLCPWLGENCRNLGDKSLEGYFSEKKTISRERMRILQDQIQALDPKIAEKEQLIKDLGILQQQRRDLIQKEAEKKTLEANLALAREKLENLDLTIKLIYERGGIADKGQLNADLGATKQALASLELDKSRKRLNEAEEKIAVLQKERKTLEGRSKEIRKGLSKLKEDHAALSEKLEKSRDVLTRYNEENAALLEKEQRQREKKRGIAQLTARISMPTLTEEEERRRSALLGLTRESGEIRNRIAALDAGLKLIDENKEKLKEAKKRIEGLTRKVNLTTAFRERIKSMGKDMSRNILLRVGVLATENFRSITGRAEEIRWSNDDNDKYLVKLASDKSAVAFDNLSGGEQVAVAIAIRSAIGAVFTRGKFSIFDEPTNNLDRERRRSLAESLGEILKNLDQSIIVTHDDTFREMAQKVIEL
jgi:exonuclease SbcC